jgi:integrase/recombinase XerD
MRKSGLSNGGCNVYIRSMNSFLTWLHQNGHIREPLKLTQLKVEKRILKPLTDQELKIIFAFRPASFTERRLIALLSVLLDTGLRINEALTLKRAKLDFDNLYLSVIGKGNKERVIPFSVELRKVLFKFLKSHDFELVFCTRHGRKMNYHNVRRDLEALLDKLGIMTDGAFHAFRRTFAKTYVKAGGNLFYLQTILGHSDVSTTRKYVDVQIEDLQAIHQSASALSRLRR